MEKSQKDYLERRIYRLKAENQSYKDRLNSLKKENQDIQKRLKKRDRLFHLLPAGILLIQEGKIIEFNDRILDQTGYRAEEILGRSFLDFVHPESLESVRTLGNKRISGRFVPEQYEVDLVSENGETIRYEIRAKKIRFHGKGALLINMIGIDVRKKKEREATQSKKREALVTMAAGLRHELEPFLKRIRQTAPDMKELVDPDNQGIMSHLETIETAANRVDSITQGILNILRPEDTDSVKRIFDLETIVRGSVEGLEKEVGEQAGKVNLKTYLRSVSPVEGDPDEIQGMVMNMILNALEAMPKGGDIYITTEENAGHAYVYIQDSGRGISEQIRERIFDPYFTTKGVDGAGLGLSLAGAIVKRHKGDIEITSRTGQGTTLIIRLPIVKQEGRTRSVSLRNRIKNVPILLIYDESVLRRLLLQVLLSKGFIVDTATNGREGLIKLKRKRFDLVIIDAGSPEMAWGELIKKIKGVDSECPVVLISEEGDGKGIRNMKKSDADLIISKPVEMNMVVNRIKELLVIKS